MANTAALILPAPVLTGSASTLSYTQVTPSPQIVFGKGCIAHSPTLNIFVGVTAGGLFYTSPDMVTWTSTVFTAADTPMCLVWGGDKFLCMGQYNGTLYTSSNGSVWAQGGINSLCAYMQALVWTGTRYIGFSSIQANSYITSLDGITWSTVVVQRQDYLANAQAVSLAEVIFAKNINAVIAISLGATGKYWLSSSGGPLLEYVFPNTADRSGVAWNGSRFVVAGGVNGAGVLTSADGVTWSIQTKPIPYTASMCAVDTTFYAITTSNLYRSFNGIDWITYPLSFSVGAWMYSVFGDRKAYAYSSSSLTRITTEPSVGNYGELFPPKAGVAASASATVTPSGADLRLPFNKYLTSSGTGADRINAQQLTVTALTPATAVAFLANGVVWNPTLKLFFGLTAAGLIYTSTDMSTWVLMFTAGSGTWYAIEYGAGKIIAVGTTEQIVSSSDGVTWVLATSVETTQYPSFQTITPRAFTRLVYARGVFSAGYNSAGIVSFEPDVFVYSKDGVFWDSSLSLPKVSATPIEFVLDDGLTHVFAPNFSRPITWEDKSATKYEPTWEVDLHIFQYAPFYSYILVYHAFGNAITSFVGCAFMPNKMLAFFRNTVYLTGNSQLYCRVSTDNGLTWSSNLVIADSSGVGNISANAIGNTVLLTTDTRTYASEDAGATWKSYTAETTDSANLVTDGVNFYSYSPNFLTIFSNQMGANLTLPTPILTGHPPYTAIANLLMPVPKAIGYGPGAAALFAPEGLLNATGHDSYGERFFGGSLPMPTLLVYGGANADLTAPPSVLSITGTATSLGNAILPCPVPTLQASGRISSMGMTALKPVDSFSIIGYSGAICSIALTGGMTIAATGTSGAVGRVSLSLPLFELTATGARQNQGSAGLLLPPPYLASGGVAYLIAPQGQLTAIGHAVVAVTYEAYAVNLQHRPKRGVEPIDEVTRYTNFPFTQIVRYQNNYFGIASDGLYLLEGTTDGGAAIPYTVKTAVSDFDTAEKKTVLSAYFGGRIGPDMTVTLHAGEIGQGVYPYTTPRGQLVQNYREKFARGIKDRYFALGIAGVGAMELDTVELEVNKLTRRI